MRLTFSKGGLIYAKTLIPDFLPPEGGEKSIIASTSGRFYSFLLHKKEKGVLQAGT